MARYTKTQFVSSSSLMIDPPKVGQWIRIDGTIRAQYLGKTERGDTVVRYAAHKFDKKSARDNASLRQFAKSVGRRLY